MPGMRRVADVQDPDAVDGRPDWVSVNVMRAGTEYSVAMTASYADVINRFPVRTAEGTLSMRSVLAHSTKHVPLVETQVMPAPPGLDELMHALAVLLHETFPYGCPDTRVSPVDGGTMSPLS